MKANIDEVEMSYRLKDSDGYSFASCVQTDIERDMVVAALKAADQKASFVPENGTSSVDAIILVIPIQ
jgi:hypothetical protein